MSFKLQVIILFVPRVLDRLHFEHNIFLETEQSEFSDFPY